ncbi:DUF2975 domain-containing protein [Couchioplanes azureus]|uniref:DUF2975 domain-containing protein n=1 Tax=Couchioplanes caeruleus TaxID=56438 RepID=UPI001670AD4A|nr:DUF2975 domain-containing protein [Couchioplanes caeruleus]GGQ60381.1 hypothetical protein GCM10010166_32500 [Couchioplanes caeruleus subsp. azureus]
MAPSPRRSGALRPLRALLTFTVIMNILGLFFTAIDWISGGRSPIEFYAPSDALINPVPDPLQPAFTPKVDDAVVVTVADPTPAQATLEVIAGGLVGTVAWLVIAVLARRIVTSALRADPFTVSTADQIRRLGIVILAAGGLAALIGVAASYALYRSVFPSSSYLGPGTAEVSYLWLPLGLAVLAFAAVVRHGCALRAELDEVI